MATNRQSRASSCRALIDRKLKGIVKHARELDLELKKLRDDLHVFYVVSSGAYPTKRKSNRKKR